MSDCNDKFVYPFTIILKIHCDREWSDDDESCIQEAESILKSQFETEGFRPTKVQILCDCEKDSICALVFFGKYLSGFQNATYVAKSCETNYCGKDDWLFAGDDSKRDNFHGWIAMEEDYICEGLVGYHLRKHCKLKTVDDIVAGKTRKITKDYIELARKIDAQDQILEDIVAEQTCKMSEDYVMLAWKIEEQDLILKDIACQYNIANLSPLPSMEKLHEKYINDGTTNMQHKARDHFWKTCKEQDKVKQELDIQRKELEFRRLEMEKREAQTETEWEKLKEEKSKVMALREMVEEIKQVLILKQDKLQITENDNIQGREESGFICKKEPT